MAIAEQYVLAPQPAPGHLTTAKAGDLCHHLEGIGGIPGEMKQP